MPETAARPDGVRRLDALVGRWASSGEMVDPVSGERTSISGTDEYSWLDGGWFLVHRVDVLIGDAPVRVLELIGERDPGSDALLCRAYDDRGTVSVMHATVDADGTWTFADDATRATLTLAPDGNAMAATWDRREPGGSWHHWMDMRFERIS